MTFVVVIGGSVGVSGGGGGGGGDNSIVHSLCPNSEETVRTMTETTRRRCK